MKEICKVETVRTTSEESPKVALIKISVRWDEENLWFIVRQSSGLSKNLILRKMSNMFKDKRNLLVGPWTDIKRHFVRVNLLSLSFLLWTWMFFSSCSNYPFALDNNSNSRIKKNNAPIRTFTKYFSPNAIYEVLKLKVDWIIEKSVRSFGWRIRWWSSETYDMH